jgi:hypothetical protein
VLGPTHYHVRPSFSHFYSDMLYLANTIFFLIDPLTHHIHGRMTRFGLHDFEGVFFVLLRVNTRGA